MAHVERRSLPPIDGADWIGTWKRSQEIVVIGSASGRRLELESDATFSIPDPDPDCIKRGIIHIGEFEANAAASGANLAFEIGDKSNPPGDEGDCVVCMRRLGPLPALRWQ